MNFSEDDFRKSMGCFATGVTIVTTKNNDSLFKGVTINSFSSVSLSPPLVLFSLDKKSHSYKNFVSSEVFIVNILEESQTEISKQFAHPSGVNWDDIEYYEGVNGCPVIKGGIAHLECEKEHLYDGGDHSIFVGRVVNLQKNSELKPLLYYKGEYSKIKE